MSVSKNMEKAWFEKHRPRTINDIVFPDKEKKLLIEESVNNGFIQGNALFFGPGGVGKTTVSKVLQHNIIKHSEDRRMLGRKTEDIDKLLSWLQQKPIASKQKIVIIEEFDRLSNQAMTILKDGPLENFQPRVAFIATTNKINKIDPALLQRFNIKFNFNTIDLEGLYYRAVKILQDENITFDENDLWLFINEFKNKGIRDIINNLQIGSLGGSFSSQRVKDFTTSTGHEDEVISYIKRILNNLAMLDISQLYQILQNIALHEDIFKAYQSIISILDGDFGFNYDITMQSLIDDTTIMIPIKKLTIDYYQDLDLKKNAKLHFIALINSYIKEIYYMKSGFVTPNI